MMNTQDGQGYRSEPLKGYVEPELKAQACEYARRKGLSDSQAVRRLVRIGLAIERRRELAREEAARKLEESPMDLNAQQVA